jgi:hypothetical protein
MAYQTQNFQEHHASRRSDHLVSVIVFLDHKLHYLLRMNQFQIPWDMTLPVVPVQILQTSFTSSLPQRTCCIEEEFRVGDGDIKEQGRADSGERATTGRVGAVSGMRC